MSEKDDYLAGFQGLRSQMTPSPELLARLEAALEGREVAPTATTPTDSRPSKKAERGKGRKAEPTPAPDPEVTPEATPAIVVGEVDEPIDSADQASEVVVTPATDEPTPDPEPPTALSEPHPAPTPKTDTQPLAKPAYKRPRYQRIKSRGLRWGIGIGGLVSALLAAVMILPQFVASPGQTSTWPQWPDPTVIKDRPGTTNPQGGQYNLADYEAIYRALAATGTKDVLATDGEPAPMPEGDTSSRPAPTAPGAGDSKDDSGNFSGTNTQVAGIDEGDIVKTDGSYLYIAKGRSVAIVTAEGANSRQLSTIDTSGLASADELLVGPVADLMINGSTLVVLLHGFEADLDGWSRASGTWFSAEATTLKAALYDISNPEKPRYLSMITQSGSYLSSRLSDGVLYLVSTYWVWEASVDPSDPTTYVPTVDCGNGPVAVSPRDVKILPGVDQPSYTVVTAIDVDSRDLLSEQAILGRTDTVYMSPDNLYLATNQWNWAVPLDDSPRPRVPGFEGEYDGSRTDIVRIGLNDGALAIEATGSVAGFPRDQFALDELDGNLRMVTTWQDTTLDWWAPIAALWVLDADLNLIGSLPRLAEKEVVESVRFDGTIAYVVTFEQVDPLFAIDLKDPTNPIVRSALKIPGFSRYLHLFGDGLLLGIGAHTELVEEEWGTRVSQTGLKLSLFDISDPFNVTESAVTIIDADSTEVEYNHKAAFVDVERGIIAFPTTTWTYDETTGAASLGWHYRVFTWDGTKFTAKTTINLAKSHPSGARLTQSDTSVRAIRVGEDLYVITAGFVNAYGMDSFNQIAQVTLK